MKFKVSLFLIAVFLIIVVTLSNNTDERVDEHKIASSYEAKKEDSKSEISKLKKIMKVIEDEKTHPEQETEENSGRNIFEYGLTPAVSPEANDDVKEVYRSLTSKNPDPHRTSSFFTKGFNVKEYKKNRQSYLKQIQPGTVFNSLTPGKDIPKIVRSSNYRTTIEQGEYVELKVKIKGSKDREMVTFTSFDLGRFENELTSINKIVDSNGEASCKFHATPGTINSVRILAASPMASGRVDFNVFVTLPSQEKVAEAEQAK